jgi:hypothetical protein
VDFHFFDSIVGRRQNKCRLIASSGYGPGSHRLVAQAELTAACVATGGIGEQDRGGPSFVNVATVAVAIHRDGEVILAEN